MKLALRKTLIVLCLVLVTTGAATLHADQLSPPAREWRSYCQTYIKALDGDSTASDLDLAYCLGVTKGLLNGMRVGAQLGALSFGSRMALKYKLDTDDVFKMFQEQEPARLLGICAPPTAATPDFVRAVLAQLDRNPGDVQRPIAEVFYESLAAAFPCR